MFTIKAQDQVIGRSDLEYGDPPMGIAFGRFIPAASFEAFAQSVEPNIREGTEVSIWNELSVASADGVAFEFTGVAVLRYAIGEGVGYQVDVMGISSPSYAELFPHHVADYERQFPSENN